jgi:site-specific DNA recombinase
LERQRVLRLLVREILVSDDKIIIRHCIPLPMASGDGPIAGSADAALPATQSYLLRSRSHQPALGEHLPPSCL